MRFACLLYAIVFLVQPSARAQSSTPTSTTSSTAVVQDPQAVNILNQALTAAGGAQAISTITDYTAKGSISYGSSQIQGTVTVQGLINGADIRIDATLPTGVSSWSVHDGIVSMKSDTGKITLLTQPSNVPSSDAFPYSTPLFPTSLVFPTLPLESAVANQGFNISSNPDTQIDGHSVHDVQLRRFAPGLSVAESLPGRSRELFVDTTTSQIVMMRDVLPKGVLQEIHYSSYQAVNGVLMPFTIISVINDQQVWSIQVSLVTFNSGLQDSAFALN